MKVWETYAKSLCINAKVCHNEVLHSFKSICCLAHLSFLYQTQRCVTLSQRQFFNLDDTIHNIYRLDFCAYPLHSTCNLSLCVKRDDTCLSRPTSYFSFMLMAGRSKFIVSFATFSSIKNVRVIEMRLIRLISKVCITKKEQNSIVNDPRCYFSAWATVAMFHRVTAQILGHLTRHESEGMRYELLQRLEIISSNP